MMTRRLLLLVLLCTLALSAAGRPPVGIAYYDVDRLYDTVPALFYDDEDYTPEGRLHWTAARYERKIQNTAAVIDSLGLDLVALWGVENEQVVRDLVAACHGDYTFLHRTLNTLDGMDFALLYYGDRFFPARVETGRRYLLIEGELRDERVAVVLCADPRMAEWVIEDLRKEAPELKPILLGRAALSRPGRLGLRDATEPAARAGRGTQRRTRGRRWEMTDRILVDTALKVEACDVYARRFLIDRHSGNPLETFSGRVYRGGYSRSLPVYIYIR